MNKKFGGWGNIGLDVRGGAFFSPLILLDMFVECDDRCSFISARNDWLLAVFVQKRLE